MRFDDSTTGPSKPRDFVESRIPSDQFKQSLNECLCEFREAAEFDKNCISNVNELVATQKQLQAAINELEKREQESLKKLQQADCMWTSMEQAYKNKIEQANKRQKLLLDKLNEIEKTNSQWKKMKSDLEIQLKHVKNKEKELDEKLAQKQNDIKSMNAEIEGLKKRNVDNKKDTELISKSFATKKKNADVQIKKIMEQIEEKKKAMAEKAKLKYQKEQEGNQMIKEAREDLQNNWKILLQKRLENEDLKLEKNTIIKDIELLQLVNSECMLKCDEKQKEIQDEIKNKEEQIKNFKVRCTFCHRGVDTEDVRNHCTDCPRCSRHRACLQDGDTCIRDPAYECVCMVTKRRFMDNVFENMYIVLEKYIQTPPGKEIGKRILDNLKNSRNGKLDKGTRKILQDFILTTVRKNLNLTIVGGAIKTRCEMDPETYKDLKLCLKEVEVQEIQKEDKSTSKKAPCKRWESTGIECNCQGGPNSCICCQKTSPLPRADDPSFPGPDDDSGAGQCPERENICGPDCGMRGIVNAENIESWRPDPCKGKTCNIMNKNMRAAQCILGPDYMSDRQEKEQFTLASDTSRNRNAHKDKGSATLVPISLEHDDTKCNEEIIKRVCFKPLVNNTVVDTKSSGIIINLSLTPSGNYCINSDQNQIKDLKDRLSGKKQLSASLKHACDEKYIIDFSQDENSTSRILLRVTSSDHLVLESPKKLINHKIPIKTTRVFIDRDKEETHLKKDIKMGNKVKQLVEEKKGRKLKPIKTHKDDVKITKTRILAASKKNVDTSISCFCPEFAIKPNKYPVKESPQIQNYMINFLSKSTEIDSSIILDEVKLTDSDKTIAYLHRTLSGTFKIQINSMKDGEYVIGEDAELYLIQVNCKKFGISKTPVVLKKTSSKYFVVLVDKEFEMIYRRVIDDFFKNKDFITLDKTSSGSYEVNIDEHINAQEQNIIKTPDNANALIDIKENAKTVLRDLSPAPKSDLTVFKHSYKTALENHNKMMSTSTLSRIKPGKYAVNFDEVSREKFIKNVKALFRNSYGNIPVISDIPGEMIITLKHKNDKDTGKEVFIITEMGDIYLLKNEVSSDIEDNDKNTCTIVSECVSASENIKPPCNERALICCNVCSDKCDVIKCKCKTLNKQDYAVERKPSNEPIIKSKPIQDLSNYSENILSPIQKTEKPVLESIVVEQNFIQESDVVTQEKKEKNDNNVLCFDSNPECFIWKHIEYMPPQLPPFLVNQLNICPCKYRIIE